MDGPALEQENGSSYLPDWPVATGHLAYAFERGVVSAWILVLVVGADRPVQTYILSYYSLLGEGKGLLGVCV